MNFNHIFSDSPVIVFKEIHTKNWSALRYPNSREQIIKKFSVLIFK